MDRLFQLAQANYVELHIDILRKLWWIVSQMHMEDARKYGEQTTKKFRPELMTLATLKLNKIVVTKQSYNSLSICFHLFETYPKIRNFTENYLLKYCNMNTPFNTELNNNRIALNLLIFNDQTFSRMMAFIHWITETHSDHLRIEGQTPRNRIEPRLARMVGRYSDNIDYYERFCEFMRD